MLKKLLHSSAQQLAKQADQGFVEYFIKAKRPGKATRQALAPRQADEFIAQLEQIADQYKDPSWIEEPARFFEPPSPAQPTKRYLRAQQGFDVYDLEWPSGYAPIDAALGDRYMASLANQTAKARAWLKPAAAAPHKSVILVHGYATGYYRFEERAWPIKALLDQGFQVLIFVLPHHGERKAQEHQKPLYPSRDVRFTLEGVRQAIHDLRALMLWLAQEQGSAHQGVMGMSLGGYISALLTTLEPSLSFCVPVIPLACFADWARQMDTLVDLPSHQEAHYQAIQRVSAVISPLSRPRQITNHHITIVGATADHVTPLSHAQKLSAHFDAPLKTFPGGHLLQVGRDGALSEAMSMMSYACR